MAFVATLSIDRLVGGDCVKPRPKPSSRIKLITLKMYLQKGSLKRILGQFRLPDISAEIAIDLTLVATDKNLKKLSIFCFLVLRDDLFIRPRTATIPC